MVNLPAVSLSRYLASVSMPAVKGRGGPQTDRFHITVGLSAANVGAANKLPSRTAIIATRRSMQSSLKAFGGTLRHGSPRVNAASRRRGGQGCGCNHHRAKMANVRRNGAPRGHGRREPARQDGWGGEIMPRLKAL